ncbi:hypothetical protein O979_20405 [Mycobacterium avium subsp. paratuberculosis 10-4404]|nr:hypothetical protein O979_20405 [Mycobacterium avium subsp. paratuberculosis 10-4404]ETB00013.1 hypothetical protein O978_20445 [Mycobacterium avium subsp. paratuberculosis 10-5864]ETB27522.1 hypothetical protein O977_21885 [Mycobacterium avium subsp. paratuberculosis 10-5975]ETB47159.1 hypothetical protein O976_22310 [Mycobacterium avium subsp. paratuberculosis 10-8425]
MSGLTVVCIITVPTIGPAVRRRRQLADSISAQWRFVWSSAAARAAEFAVGE